MSKSVGEVAVLDEGRGKGTVGEGGAEECFSLGLEEFDGRFSWVDRNSCTRAILETLFRRCWSLACWTMMRSCSLIDSGESGRRSSWIGFGLGFVQ